jgi:hypothetical protein
VRASHPDLSLLIDAALQARAARTDVGRLPPFDVSVWTMWDDALADPDHADRRRWHELGVGRLILVWLQPHDPAAVARFVV